MTTDKTILMTERSTAPDTPSTSDWRLYFKSTGLFVVDDAGAEVGPLTGSGSAQDVSADTLTLNDGSELTIAAGAITVTHARHTVDTEGDASSDDLDTVNGLAANEVCLITANNTARTVVVKNGTGNITCATGADISLDDDIKAVLLVENTGGTGVNAYPVNGGGGGGSIGGSTGGTDNALLRADGTGGSTLQNSGVIVDDSDNVSGINSLESANAAGLDIKDQADNTKVARLDVSGITTATTRTITVPDSDITLVGTALAQTLTNKTIDGDNNTISNVINADHGARAHHSVNQSVATGTFTALSLDSERWDTDAYHDTVTNNTRMTVPSGLGGKYIISGHIRFDTNSTGARMIGIRLNGTTYLVLHRSEASSAHYMSIATVFDLSATDYVELIGWQSSGGSLDVTSEGNTSPEITVQRIA